MSQSRSAIGLGARGVIDRRAVRVVTDFRAVRGVIDLRALRGMIDLGFGGNSQAG